MNWRHVVRPVAFVIDSWLLLLSSQESEGARFLAGKIATESRWSRDVGVKGSKLIKVGIDTFRKPENGEQRRDMLLVLMSVLL